MTYFWPYLSQFSATSATAATPLFFLVDLSLNRYLFRKIIIFVPQRTKNALFFTFFAKKFAKPYFFIVPLHRLSREKRLSRTEEGPVDVLRSKCGARAGVYACIELPYADELRCF